jgi:predicted transcriptional regulator YdeE
MQIEILHTSEIKLIGLQIRTNNQDEINLKVSKIVPLMQRYFGENLAEKIPHRKNPGVGVVGYSNYESDEHGAYDYLFGEEVSSFEDVPEGFSCLTIPAGKFLKITSDAGPMPDIIAKTWPEAWWTASIST